MFIILLVATYKKYREAHETHEMPTSHKNNIIKEGCCKKGDEGWPKRKWREKQTNLLWTTKLGNCLGFQYKKNVASAH